MNLLHFEFKKYFIELKFKIWYSLLTIIFTMIVCYINIYPLLYIFSKYLLNNINSNKFFFSNIVQIFFTYIEISLYFSLIITFPFILLNFLQYFIPSLYIFEFWYCIKFLCASIFCFLISILFTYFLLFPNFLTFFFNFENSNQFFPIFFEAKFDEYFFFVLNIFIKSIFIFQIPIIIFLFSKLKLIIIDKNFFFQKRNYVYLCLLILSAFINPPEIFLQIIFFFIFVIFFEFFIFINLFLLTLKQQLSF